MAGLKFRVLLDSEDKNEVFRDILVNDAENFENFYTAIIKSFGFQGDQMASFYVSNDDWDKGQEISLMDMSYDDEAAEGSPAIMKDTILKKFIEEPDQKFILVYDFMRMWIFLVELVGYEKEGPATPEVLFSVGMAPPEDSKQPVDQFDGDFAGNEFEDDFDDNDEFGFDDFEDGYEDEFGGGNFDEYDY